MSYEANRLRIHQQGKPGRPRKAPAMTQRSDRQNATLERMREALRAEAERKRQAADAQKRALAAAKQVEIARRNAQRGGKYGPK